MLSALRGAVWKVLPCGGREAAARPLENFRSHILEKLS